MHRKFQAPRLAASSSNPRNSKLINLEPQPTTPTATELSRVLRIIAHSITLPLTHPNRVTSTKPISTITTITILHPSQQPRIRITRRPLSTRRGAAEIDTVIDAETIRVLIGSFIQELRIPFVIVAAYEAVVGRLSFDSRCGCVECGVVVDVDLVGGAAAELARVAITGCIARRGGERGRCVGS